VPHDLVVRHGLIVDGTGREPVPGDIAVDRGFISAVGAVADDGGTEIDAEGCVVTPGFVDIHTHYDGQSIWSEHLAPSSMHGVTTAVMGNCGVGFAPCRSADHDLLVNAMEGVEDIPEVVMTEGLQWDWETFPDYLDAVAGRPHDIDVATFLPHSPLRVYAMGARGAAGESATAEDIQRMADIAREAVQAGALGFATSRTEIHRRGDGEHLPSFNSGEPELTAIAAAFGGRGIVQLVTNLVHEDTERDKREEIALLERISARAGVAVTFSINQQNSAPEMFPKIMDWVDEANTHPGVSIHPQFAPRPIGVHVGLDLSVNPFSACPTYRAIAGLPLRERVARLREPRTRDAIIHEAPTGDVLPIVLAARQFDKTYLVTEPPTYEPEAGLSVAAIARQRGVTTEELAFDLLLGSDGHAMLYVALSNYGYGNLDHLVPMFQRPDSVIGLGDGGAHYGMICDGSYPTFVLTHWTRQREKGRLPPAEAIRALTSVPADLAGLRDRGRLAPGHKADINVIDYDGLRLHAPKVAYDLPAGGRRLTQAPAGYRYTIVSGKQILQDDAFTGQLPGELVRGRQSPR
jgi:N-acyl-D-aspartate/D-glutamate deacylase